MRRSTWTCAVVIAGALSGCGGASTSRTEVVAEMTDAAVPERFGALAADATTLTNAVEQWCESSDDGATREDVGRVREAWVSLAPFWIGPVMDRRSRFVIDPSVRADEVQALLDGSEDIDAVALRC
jgi:predicted lipoprotein